MNLQSGKIPAEAALELCIRAARLNAAKDPGRIRPSPAAHARVRGFDQRLGRQLRSTSLGPGGLAAEQRRKKVVCNQVCFGDVRLCNHL
jgi:hypothetical protein